MHPLNRASQPETFRQVVQTNKKWTIIEAPTGFGKSAIPAALSTSGYQQEYCQDQTLPALSRIIANVRTKSLQSQYGGSYDFAILKGLDNYECLAEPGQTAADCHKCDNKTCPYKIAKSEFLSSNAGTLNYAKFLMSKQVVDQFQADYLFLDEAHQLSDLVCEWSGISFNWYSKNGRPNYVLDWIDKPTHVLPEKYGQEVCWGMGVQWLESLRDSLEDGKPNRPGANASKEELRAWRRYNELVLKVDTTLSFINSGRELWYIRSDYDGFTCKPLTARFHFPRLFDKATKIVLMSATIGQFTTFATELGLSEYEVIKVPNAWPAPLRLIEDLGGPEYTFKLDENGRNHHAQLIASRLNLCPAWWTGLIHVTSKSMATELGERLRWMTNRPVLIPFEGWGTEETVEEWGRFYRSSPGALCVWWGGWEGIDAGENQISIVARCPFPDFKSPYERARFEFDRRASLQRITNQVVQAWGRVRRGREQDYGPTKLVAICDAKWKRLRNFISQDILESIQTVEYA